MSEKVGYKEIFETLRKEVLDGKYDDTTVLPSEWEKSGRLPLQSHTPPAKTVSSPSRR